MSTGIPITVSWAAIRKSDGHKLPCLFEAGSYEAHYMTTGSKERIFPHTFAFDRSYDAVGGGRVDVLILLRLRLSRFCEEPCP